MNTKPSDTTKHQAKRLDEAAENLKRILKEIEPYVREAEVENYSTAGKWQAADGINDETALTNDALAILRRVSRPIDEHTRI